MKDTERERKRDNERERHRERSRRENEREIQGVRKKERIINRNTWSEKERMRGMIDKVI
jgi:hypothetical protein